MIPEPERGAMSMLPTQWLTEHLEDPTLMKETK